MAGVLDGERVAGVDTEGGARREIQVGPRLRPVDVVTRPDGDEAVGETVFVVATDVALRSGHKDLLDIDVTVNSSAGRELQHYEISKQRTWDADYVFLDGGGSGLPVVK